MTANVEAFDKWARSGSAQMNTELEELYFAREARQNVIGIGDSIKQERVDEGRGHIVDLLEEGNTDVRF